MFGMRTWRSGELPMGLRQTNGGSSLMRSFIMCTLISRGKVKKVKLSLCLTKHYAMKAYGE
jgi:hypothetical protein